MQKLFATTALAATLIAGAASAETMATAGTDLNLRAGPGAMHDVIGVIKNGDEVSVTGCIESANWCEVGYDGKTGWAYGDYLTAKVGDKIEPLYPNRQTVGVTVIQAPAADASDNKTADTAVAGTTGAAMGALVGGPIGAVVGAALGSAAGSAANPPAEVKTYVMEHPVDPVHLQGEVVLGAGVPDTVTLYDVPDQPDYKYVTINGQPVLVNPADRKIVYIYR